MKKVLRVVLLVIVVISSFFVVWFSSKTDNQKFLAPLFFFLTLASLLVYALICPCTSEIEPNDEETSLAENKSANEKRSLEEFEKDRAHELEDLLTKLEAAQTNLHFAIESRDIEKISNTEKSLNVTITSVLDFFENYSRFGRTMYYRKSK